MFFNVSWHERNKYQCLSKQNLLILMSSRLLEKSKNIFLLFIRWWLDGVTCKASCLWQLLHHLLRYLPLSKTRKRGSLKCLQLHRKYNGSYTLLSNRILKNVFWLLNENSQVDWNAHAFNDVKVLVMGIDRVLGVFQERNGMLEQ